MTLKTEKQLFSFLFLTFFGFHHRHDHTDNPNVIMIICVEYDGD